MCLNPHIVYAGHDSCTGKAFPIFSRELYQTYVAPTIERCAREGKPFFPYHHGFMEIKCNKCIECRKSYTNQWAIRICKEAEKYENNCFVTLTYDPESYPGHLVKDHLRKFVKDLRNKYRKSLKIRFYGVGEYGKKTCRAHYHIVIFNYKPSDLVPFFTKKGVTTYLSQEIRDIWKKGNITVQDVNEQSACYVAKYLHKVLPKSPVEEDYPCFGLMSRRNGIGLDCITEKEKAQGFIQFKRLKASLPRAVKSFVQSLKDFWDQCMEECDSAQRDLDFDRDLFARQAKHKLTLKKLRQRNAVYNDII